MTYIHPNDRVYALERALAAGKPVGQDQPLRVFSAGVWTYDRTGQSFSHHEMDAAAIVVYRDSGPPSSHLSGDAGEVGQEPMGEVYQGSARLPQARLTMRLPIGALLYAAPPVQSVHLMQFRESVLIARGQHEHCVFVTGGGREKIADCDRLLALVDGEAVGNG